MLRFLTAGESHGQALTAIIEGLPAGIKIDLTKINLLLQRRQGGYGRGKRMEIEQDRVEFLAGLRGLVTLGSPLTMQIKNRDWENWRTIMDAEKAALPQERVVTRPRPGHADLPGSLKYRQDDLRNILERASARETAARVAVGAVAQEFLGYFGIRLQAQVVSIGNVTGKIRDIIHGEELYQDPLYCPDHEASKQMMKAVDQARAQGDSLGGSFQVLAEGLPPGLGSHVQWDKRLDGVLTQAVMSIPAIKGVEIGLGFAAASLPGSQAHDEIIYTDGKGYSRKTNRSGGLEGGMTNGEMLVVRAAMKPIPTLCQPLWSVDIHSKEPFPATVERSDVCAVPAAAIVGEAMVAWVLAAAVMEKFGGDHLEETLDSYQNYLRYLKTR